MDKDLVAFVYVFPGFCTVIQTQRIYIGRKKGQTGSFEYLLILSKRFVSGTRNPTLFWHVNAWPHL